MRKLAFAWLVLACAGGSALVTAQDFPIKPVRIVTGDPGGATDVASRLIAQNLPAGLGQQVIVENRPAGIIPGDIVSKSPADGHTLLVSGSILWIGPFLQADVPYDPVRDFAPITLVSRSPNVLVVHPSIPANSVKELISHAASRPGALNYATTGTGASSHLAGELFKSMASVNLVRVNYKGVPPALNDVMAGRVQLMFAPAATVLPLVKSGKLRALAVTSAQPTALAPGLATVAESALPDYESVVTIGIFAPSKTPALVIGRLNQEIVRVLAFPEVKEAFFKRGSDVAMSTPAQFGAIIKSEMTRLGKIIKEAGIRPE